MSPNLFFHCFDAGLSESYSCDSFARLLCSRSVVILFKILYRSGLMKMNSHELYEFIAGVSHCVEGGFHFKICRS